MLFVSAQPDHPYMAWEAEIYGHNFQRLGIPPHQIVMLFALLDGKPPSEYIRCLAKIYRVHWYYDDRPGPDKQYIPSLRLMNMRRFFKEHDDELRHKHVFYHDADIIFRRLPDFYKLTKLPKVVMSNTAGYLGANVVDRTAKAYAKVDTSVTETTLFESMCESFKWQWDECRDTVRRNDGDATGGAQTLFQNLTDAKWWEDAYTNTMTMFHDMGKFERAHPKQSPEGDPQFGWKADMFGVLWSLWKAGIDTTSDKSLDFSWPVYGYDDYKSKNILHMAGVTDECPKDGPFANGECRFYKARFINSSPLDAQCKNRSHFDFVSKTSASFAYVQEIIDLVEHSTITEEEEAKAFTCFECRTGGDERAPAPLHTFPGWKPAGDGEATPQGVPAGDEDTAEEL
ncbi:glycosyltransferase [Pseudoscourfieldia marina]